MTARRPLSPDATVRVVVVAMAPVLIALWLASVATVWSLP